MSNYEKLLFQHESREDILRAKERAQTEIVVYDRINLDIGREDFYSNAVTIGMINFSTISLIEFE